MSKPRIFLGSSGKQAKMLQALDQRTRGRRGRRPWTATFNPDHPLLGRLVELTHEVDFACLRLCSGRLDNRRRVAAGQASPRDNVVLEAGLFGGVLGMERTFILHANGAKLPTDLLGLTCVRYGEASSPSQVSPEPEIAQGDRRPSRRLAPRGAVVAALDDRAKRPGTLRGQLATHLTRSRRNLMEVNGRLAGGGTLSARYWSEAARELKGPDGRLLRLEWRAPTASERTCDLRHRSDQASRPRTEPPAIGPPGRMPSPASTPEPRASTFEPTPQTSRCWRRERGGAGPAHRASASGSGSRPRTRSEATAGAELLAPSLRRLGDRLHKLTGHLLVLAEGDVGLGNDADEPAVLDHGQPPNLVACHQLERLFEVPCRAQR